MGKQSSKFKLTTKEFNAIKSVLNASDSLTKKYDKLTIDLGNAKTKLARLIFTLNIKAMRELNITNGRWVFNFNARTENWSDHAKALAVRLIGNNEKKHNFLHTSTVLATKFLDVKNDVEIYDTNKLPGFNTWSKLGVDKDQLKKQIGSKAYGKFEKKKSVNTLKAKSNKKIAKEVIKIKDLTIRELTNHIIIKTNKMSSIKWEQLGDNSQPTKKEMVDLLNATEHLAQKIRETRATTLAKVS
jgi:phage pi2 protein 07